MVDLSSIPFGLGTAVAWAVATLLLARSARGSDPLAFALLFLLYQATLLLPFGIAAALTRSWEVQDLPLAAVAGLAQAIGVISYTHALRLSPVAVVAALVSLEGVVAAVLAVATGERIALLSSVGLVIASVGGLLLGVAARASGSTRGVLLACLTALGFGAGLWLIDQSQLPDALTLLVFNTSAAMAVLAFAGSHGRWAVGRVEGRSVLMAAAAASVTGYALFAIGASRGSLAVTAVLAAQFAVLTAVGAYFWFGERLTRLQVASVLLLVAGVASVTAPGS